MKHLSNDLEQAKGVLQTGYTCVLQRGNEQESSTKRGVAPLLAWLSSGKNYHGFSAADKVVGKAAAYLYVLLGVKEVYAHVVSEAAESVLTAHQIPLFYEEKVPAIRNRTNTGFCPMEQAVWEIDDPLLAKQAIVQKLDQLRGNTP